MGAEGRRPGLLEQPIADAEDEPGEEVRVQGGEDALAVHSAGADGDEPDTERKR